MRIVNPLLKTIPIGKNKYNNNSKLANKKKKEEEEREM